MEEQRILLVTDHEEERAWARVVLERALPCRVFTTRCGKTALTAVRRCPPHLVLVDLEIGCSDGLGFLERLASDPEAGKVPALILSCPEREGAKYRAILAGAAGWLEKPLSEGELVRRVVEQVDLSEKELPVFS